MNPIKTYITLTVILLVVFLAGCKSEPIVGGDKDEHGCIGSAGYTWCESKNKCLRIWEEECPGNQLSEGYKAKTVAEDYIKEMAEYKEMDGSDISVIDTIPMGCEGCWLVVTEYSLIPPGKQDKVKAIVKLTLNNWEVSYVERTAGDEDAAVPDKEYITNDPEQCTVIDYACDEGEPFQDEEGCGCQKV